MALVDHLNAFRQRVAKAEALIRSAHAPGATGQYLWSLDDRRTITEASLLTIFIAWESFLEQTLVDYLMGLPSARGNNITKFAAPIDDEHARKILIGTQKYVDYANPEIVRKLSKLYLQGGGPHETTLASIQSRLIDLRTIRNAAAHLSSTTSDPLDALATRLLGTPKSKITVYELILADDPAVPPDPGTGARQSILQSYIQQLDVAADQIVRA